jgi:hypothetical protein
MGILHFLSFPVSPPLSILTHGPQVQDPMAAQRGPYKPAKAMCSSKCVAFQQWWCYEQRRKPGGHRLKLPDLYETYQSQRPWTQQQGMRHLSLPATIKNQHLFKKELDDTVKNGNIRLAKKLHRL